MRGEHYYFSLTGGLNDAGDVHREQAVGWHREKGAVRPRHNQEALHPIEMVVNVETKDSPVKTVSRCR